MHTMLCPVPILPPAFSGKRKDSPRQATEHGTGRGAISMVSGVPRRERVHGLAVRYTEGGISPLGVDPLVLPVSASRLGSPGLVGVELIVNVIALRI